MSKLAVALFAAALIVVSAAPSLAGSETVRDRGQVGNGLGWTPLAEGNGGRLGSGGRGGLFGSGGNGGLLGSGGKGGNGGVGAAQSGFFLKGPGLNLIRGRGGIRGFLSRLR